MDIFRAGASIQVLRFVAKIQDAQSSCNSLVSYLVVIVAVLLHASRVISDGQHWCINTCAHTLHLTQGEHPILEFAATSRFRCCCCGSCLLPSSKSKHCLVWAELSLPQQQPICQKAWQENLEFLAPLKAAITNCK